MGLTKVVPFLVEDEMLKLGAVFSKVADWGVHVVSDGLLITAQNPASSRPRREYADESGKAKGHTSRQRSRVVEMGRQVVIFSGIPAWGLSI